MLKEWILQIRQDRHYYCADHWKYRISGSVLELSVLPANTKDKQIYRCSVITVGQVLRALSCKIEDVESHFLIQSFPAIETPEIIATIRMDKNSYHTDTFPPCNPEYAGDSVYSRVEYLSHLYQFSLQPCDVPEKKFLPKNNDFQNHCWYALASRYDNPFTWLNVGYWKESLLKDCRNDISEKPWPLLDFCNNCNGTRPEMPLDNNLILQAIFGIRKGSPS